MSSVPVAPKATRREWIGLAVIALPCFLVAMDMTVLNLAIPHLSADLKPRSSQLLWIVDIYGFLIAGSLVTMGTLGDRIGRRRLLLIGALAFGIASTLAAFSRSAEMLIAMRALLGVAGATLAPSTLSLIRNMFLNDRQRTVAISIWMMSFSLGGTIGPLIGGLLLEYFWWGSVFLANVPVMALLLLLGPVLLPEFKDPKAGRLDLASAGLSLIAVLSVIYGMKQLAESGLSVVPIVSVLIGLLLGYVFLRRQKRLSYPFVDLGLFQKREFSTALAMNTLVVVALFGVYFLIAQYLQLVLRLTPLQAGFVSIPPSLAFMLGSMFVPRLSQRIRPVYLIAGGLLLSTPGFILIAQIGLESGVWLAVVGSIIYQIALSPVFTLSTSIVVGSAPPERAGAAAAISETSYELGGALGVATLGSLGSVLYRARMSQELMPGTPVEFVVAAKNTLGAAVAVAGAVPTAAAELALGTAREAFVYSLHAIAWISAAMIALTALVVARLLRHVKLPS